MEFVTDVQQLKIESVRLDTFHCWSIVCPIRPNELARQGFYFTGENDSVRCIFCQGQLNEWTADDVVSTEHSKWFPDCPFVQGKDCGNVAMMMESNIKHPPYIMFYDRMESFRDWHKEVSLSPNRMASAGFFQITPFDHVKCFSCGLRLNKWKATDNPWDEHKKFSPDCPFVLERYGCFLGFDVSLQLSEFKDLQIRNHERTSPRISPRRVLTNPLQETNIHGPVQESTPFEASQLSAPTTEFNHLQLLATSSFEPVPIQPSPPLQPKMADKKERRDNLDELGTEELKQIILEQEDERLCKICFERNLKVIFIPCNHMVCCAECGEQQRLCPICRTKIERVNQIFFS